MLFNCLLLTAYFFILYFIIKKNAFIQNSGLSTKLIALLFTGKILVGFAYIFIEYHFLQGGDLEGTFFNSLSQTTLLKKDPWHFISSAFQSGYDNYSGLYNSRSYWNDLRNIFLEKTVGILNLFSFNNLYIDSLFYNFFIFFGHIAFYRAFKTIWPQLKTPILIGCFFIPSSMFFLSGINKDSLVFLAVSLIIYAISNSALSASRASAIRRMLLLFGALSFLFIIRNFFFTAMIPVLLAYYLSGRFNTKPIYIYAAISGIVALIFFSSPGLMNIVCLKQADFLQLGWAKSAVPVTVLEPNIKSFITHLPGALNTAFCRPYIWDSYSIFYFVSALELLILVILVSASVVAVIKNKKNLFGNRLVLFCIFFALLSMLIIGYTIPILGAVTRYRSAFLPLLITPFLCSLNWSKLKWFK